MDYEILRAVGKNILWLILMGWSIFRFYKYSPTKFPRPDSCLRKDYQAWREMEALGIQLAVTGTVVSVIATVFIHPRNIDAAVKFSMIRSAFFLLGAIAIPIVQSLAKDKGKKIGAIE